MTGPFPRFGFPNMTQESWLGKIMTKLPIRKIRVRSRYRKALGDIESLAASIKELGLLHLIVVRPDGRLIAGERMPSCISLAGAMCSRRERAFSTCQGHRTTALPSPCLDTLRTSARAHAVAPRARASPCFAQPLRGTRPNGLSQWAWHAPFRPGRPLVCETIERASGQHFPRLAPDIPEPRRA
jgi:hypothetical protein